jgi:quercetin dioxygenase-like cupin family protein
VELLVTKPGAWRAGTIKVTRAEDAPAFDAFGLHWRLLAAGADTENSYDVFDVVAHERAGMPTRILGADEAIYVLEGKVKVESDGQSIGGEIGSLTYVPAGSIVSWQAVGDRAS